MMEKNKKSQAALEFLMTYGWAILAAVIVIGVLAYFVVFSPGNGYINRKCLAEEFCEFYDMEYYMYTSETIECKELIMEEDYVSMKFVDIDWDNLQELYPECE